MDYKYIPFYMQGIPVSGMYLGNAGAQDKDMAYVKEMYPRAFAQIEEIVEKILDKQEFIGSMIYDEYPDKMGIYRMVEDAFDELKANEVECEGNNCIKYPEDQWLKDIIKVLLLHEMYRRRAKRKQNRWFF